MDIGPLASTQPATQSKQRSSSHRRGLFVVVDGLDAIGKGTVERAIVEYEQKRGSATFDSISWSRAHSSGLPELRDFWDPPNVHYHVVITAEPAYCGTGHDVRDELIARNGRNYPVQTIIAGYAVDREIQMKKVVIPALQNGLTVVQGRCVASTICYQGHSSGKAVEEIPNFAKKISKYEGNRMQLDEWSPDLLIIPTVRDVEKVIERMKARGKNGKDDKSEFDRIEFQGRIKPFYESPGLKRIFEETGTRVVYLDADGTVEHTQNEAVRIYREFLDEVRTK